MPWYSVKAYNTHTKIKKKENTLCQKIKETREVEPEMTKMLKPSDRHLKIHEYAKAGGGKVCS